MTSSRPAYAYLLPTGRCNLHCSGCYATLEDFGRNSRRGELEIAEYREVIRELYEMGVRTFDISGGEPLLYPALTALCEAIHQYAGTRTWVVTNGTTGRREKLRELAAFVDRIVFSLDAPAPDLHDELRGARGAFTKTIETLRAAREMGFPEIGVNFVVSRHNVGTVQDMMRLTREESVNRLSLLTFRDVSENGVLYDLIPRLSELQGMWQVVSSALADSPWPRAVDLVSPAFLFPESTAFRRSLPPEIRDRVTLHHPHLRGHSAFRDTIVIKPFGTLSGDTAMVNSALFDLGSIRNGVAAVWETEAASWRARLADRQAALRAEGPCRSCSRWHVCRGGCPAAAFHQWSNFLKHDRSCDSFRENGNFQ